MYVRAVTNDNIELRIVLFQGFFSSKGQVYVKLQSSSFILLLN